MPTSYRESDLLVARRRSSARSAARPIRGCRRSCDWLYDNIDYQLGSSNATTTARDVFRSAPACAAISAPGRDLLPGAEHTSRRLVVGYALFEKPPPDFHAVFEAYPGGRWVMFDPTRMSPVDELIRIATGGDAKDAAFATIFGPATMTSMNSVITAR